MNVITIAGNLGGDAELRTTNSGEQVLRFSVADNQGTKDKPITVWWDCALYGRRAEVMAQYLTKGTSVTVVGQARQRDYVDRDGITRRAIGVRVQELSLQGSATRRAQDAPPPSRSAQSAPRSASAPAQAAPRSEPGATGTGFDDLEDDVPF